MYSPLWKITHQTPSVLCTPPFEKLFIKIHRFCVLPPLKITVFGERFFRGGRFFRQIRYLCLSLCTFVYGHKGTAYGVLFKTIIERREWVNIFWLFGSLGQGLFEQFAWCGMACGSTRRGRGAIFCGNMNCANNLLLVGRDNRDISQEKPPFSAIKFDLISPISSNKGYGCQKNKINAPFEIIFFQ